MVSPDNADAESSNPRAASNSPEWNSGVPSQEVSPSTAAPPRSEVPPDGVPSTSTLPTLLLDGEEVEIPTGLQNHPRYRLIRVIGRGGMGEVFLAEHRLMNRNVVLKTIRVDCADHPTFVERFLREVRAISRLNHPNVVTVYDAEQTGDTFFLVMEYLEGEDLNRLVRRTGPLDVTTACVLVRQATTGVKHAHERGILHRDIKPNNLILLQSEGMSGGGLVKILDFGLAKILEDEGVSRIGTPSGFAMGTRGFMAPEQDADARSAGVQADIFSLGRTLYYLLSGKIIHEGEGRGSISEGSGRDPEVPLPSLEPEVPSQVVRLIEKMTARRTEDRFQSCEEVLQILAPLCEP